MTCYYCLPIHQSGCASAFKSINKLYIRPGEVLYCIDCIARGLLLRLTLQAASVTSIQYLGVNLLIGGSEARQHSQVSGSGIITNLFSHRFGP